MASAPSLAGALQQALPAQELGQGLGLALHSLAEAYVVKDWKQVETNQLTRVKGVETRVKL